MNSGQLGREGELLFQTIMESGGYTVEDVSGNSEYWDKDIDFIITSPYTGAVKTFEVKFDSRINKTGNLFLETASAYSKGGQGWFKFCEADYLAYGDSANRRFYVIPLLELKERVKKLPQRIARCGQESIGLLVSLNDIKDIIKIV